MEYGGAPVGADDGVPTGGEGQHPTRGGRATAVGVEQEVAEAIVDVGPAEVAGADQHVGVRADDDIRAGCHQLPGEVGGVGLRALVPLDAPVQIDHDGVAVGARPADRVEQYRGLLGTGEPRLARSGRPPGDGEVVQHLGGPDDGNPLAPDRPAPRGEGSCLVDAGTDDGHPGGPARAQGVAQTDQAVVLAVVVRDRDDVDAAGLQGGEGRGRRPEHELLGLGRAPVGDGGLQVDHRQVGAAKQGRDRLERRRRVVEQTSADRALEVHVTAERQRDRPPGRYPADRRAQVRRPW